MEKRKTIKIKPADWKKLKLLATNQDMTIQAEVDAIIETFLACTEDSKENRRGK